MSLPRPAVFQSPGLPLALIAFALYGLARATGAGWLVVLLCWLAGLLVVAAGLAAAGVGRVRIGVTAPRDATAGHPASFTVAVEGSRGLKVRLAEPAGEWVRGEAGTAVAASAVPALRGIVRAVVVELRSAAPLGLVWWRRSVRVELPRPMEVGPDPRPVRVSPPTAGADGRSGDKGAGATGDVIRGVREYVEGDLTKLVHWPATARHGELMVKELETPASTALALVVDLRGDPDRAEQVAAEAAGLANAALGAGVPVTLLTAERGGPRAGAVSSPVEVGRRLARAVAGRPPDARGGPGTAVVRLGGYPSGGKTAPAGLGPRLGELPARRTTGHVRTESEDVG